MSVLKSQEGFGENPPKILLGPNTQAALLMPLLESCRLPVIGTGSEVTQIWSQNTNLESSKTNKD